MTIDCRAIPLLAQPFYFLRHGQTESNVRGTIAGSLNIPLTERGHAEARAAVVALERHDVTAIYSSALRRAGYGRNHRSRSQAAGNSHTESGGTQLGRSRRATTRTACARGDPAVSGNGRRIHRPSSGGPCRDQFGRHAARRCALRCISGVVSRSGHARARGAHRQCTADAVHTARWATLRVARRNTLIARLEATGGNEHCSRHSFLESNLLSCCEPIGNR